VWESGEGRPLSGFRLGLALATIVSLSRQESSLTELGDAAERPAEIVSSGLVAVEPPGLPDSQKFGRSLSDGFDSLGGNAIESPCAATSTFRSDRLTWVGLLPRGVR